ncbi:MAG TPA: hypothetical protein VJ347_20360, partial [Streptosporangiaceae bacterium]|nr:hypothetical protein [Streptosporangiaceae bacterium]
MDANHSGPGGQWSSARSLPARTPPPGGESPPGGGRAAVKVSAIDALVDPPSGAVCGNSLEGVALAEA